MTTPTRPPPGPPTGVRIVIVGAGIGGLACAIESRQVGHEVTLLESVKQFKRLGDSIGCFPNSGRLMKRWGIHDELMPHCGTAQGFTIRKWNGEMIVHQEPKGGMEIFRDAPLYDTHRAELHEILLKRAIELGATVKQGCRVLSYAETENGASVECDGIVYEGDVVIGADGVKSQARERVLGIADAPKPSGYAIFRAYFDADLVRSDPVCAHLAPVGKDARTAWIGPDVHFIVSTLKQGKELNYVFTHLDTADVAEGWVEESDVADAVAWLDGWDPVVQALVEKTPPGALLDWKLVFRDPLPTWVSATGHIAVIGDAAHPFLPTSQQGASQAIEDGVTVAHALALAKRAAQPLANALRAYQAMRYERVKRAQLLGVQNREMWHGKGRDWSKPIDGESVKLPHADWLWDHDATAFTHENYDRVVKELTHAPKTSTAADKPRADLQHIEHAATAALAVGA